MSADGDTTRLADRERLRQRRMNRIVWALVPTAILALAGAAVSTVIAEGKSAQVDGLSKALTAQCQQTKRLGHNCVAAPAPSVRANPAQPTVSPVPSPIGPSDEQVRAAVAVYFQEHPVTNNTPPDPSVVQAFVDAYLKAHPALAGPSGSPGVQGSPGTNGKDGATGQPGRGVDHFSCDPSTTELTVFYTDSTTQNLGAGSCGQGPKGDKGDPGQPIASYTFTTHGPLGGNTTYRCVWDGQSTTEPNYDCTQQ